MCIARKHPPLIAALISALAINTAAADDGMRSAGGVVLGDAKAGVTDRAFVTAPPNFAYVLEREAGSFVDCGDGSEPRSTDGDGRDMAKLPCGVTLTETIFIPAAAASARLIVHY